MNKIGSTDILQVIEEAMNDRLTDDNASEYPFGVYVSFDKCGSNLTSIGHATEDNTNWLQERNIPFKTKIMHVAWPAINKNYFFKNEQDALLFIIGQAGKYGTCSGERI